MTTNDDLFLNDEAWSRLEQILEMSEAEAAELARDMGIDQDFSYSNLDKIATAIISFEFAS